MHCFISVLVLRLCLIHYFNLTVKGVSLVFRATILLLITSISGLIAEHVTLFPPESRSVNYVKHFTASSTDSKTSKSCQVSLNGILFSLDYADSIVLFYYALHHFHLWSPSCATSPFNFFSGKFFCHCASLNSFCRFQLYEKDDTTVLHTPITQSIHGSLTPLLMA